MALKDIAQGIGVWEVDLVGLNPELRYKVTPDEEYLLKTPPGKGQLLVTSLDKIPNYVPPPLVRKKKQYVHHRVHRVRKGETIGQLARVYHVSANEIARANSLSETHRLQVGQNLIIPLRGKR